MNRLKEQVLRDYGDEGADTLERYFAQIEYTAFWCIRMLHEAEQIMGVIPEMVEDTVIEKKRLTELHQVKTRDESKGHWTTSDVLPILCQQYNRSSAFSGQCNFHFASDQMADNKTALRPGTYGSLYQLKHYLEVLHDGQTLTPEEQQSFDNLKSAIIPRIQELMKKNHNKDIDANTATNFLLDTWINTNSPLVRKPDNLSELEAGLAGASPGSPSYSFEQLQEIYARLILLIIKRIISTTTKEARRISCDDVLNCRSAAYSMDERYPDLDRIPGKTHLDKKASLGGFHATELPTFHRQKALAETTRRRLENLGLVPKIQQLTVALLECHRVSRHKVCRELGVLQNPGPVILSMFKSQVQPIIERYFPDSQDVDEQFCIGLLWRETNMCQAWWHNLESLVSGINS